MARQRSTSRPAATSAEANAARVLSQLDRMSKVARQSDRVSRTAARVALSGNHRLELPAQSLQLKDGQIVEAGAFVDRRTALGGSESDSGSTSSSSEAGNRGKTSRVESTWHRATAMVDVACSSRKIPELTHAMDALSRVERSIDSGSTAPRDSGCAEIRVADDDFGYRRGEPSARRSRSKATVFRRSGPAIERPRCSVDSRRDSAAEDFAARVRATVERCSRFKCRRRTRGDHHQLVADGRDQCAGERLRATRCDGRVADASRRAVRSIETRIGAARAGAVLRGIACSQH